MAEVHPKALSLSQGCNQSIAQNRGHLKAHLGANLLPSSLSLTLLWAGLRASAAHWLLASGLPLFCVRRASP